MGIFGWAGRKAKAQEKEETYTVVAGDSLWRIADRELGDGRMWHAIYDANRDTITDPDILPPGQILRIPKKG